MHSRIMYNDSFISPAFSFEKDQHTIWCSEIFPAEKIYDENIKYLSTYIRLISNKSVRATLHCIMIL